MSHCSGVTPDLIELVVRQAAGLVAEQLLATRERDERAGCRRSSTIVAFFERLRLLCSLRVAYSPGHLSSVVRPGRRHVGGIRDSSPCIYEAASVAVSSYSAYAWSTRSRTRS